MLKYYIYGLPRCLSCKELVANAEDTGYPCLIPGSGRSPRKGNGKPLHFSCLGNPIDRGAWQATVHEVSESRPWLMTRQSYNFLLYILKTVIKMILLKWWSDNFFLLLKTFKFINESSDHPTDIQGPIQASPFPPTSSTSAATMLLLTELDGKKTGLLDISGMY